MFEYKEVVRLGFTHSIYTVDENTIFRQVHDKKGYLVEAYTYYKGKYHGIYQQWNEGVLKVEGCFVFGSPIGLHKQYDQSGQLLACCFFGHHGSGADITYDDDGLITYESYFEHGLQQGVDRDWNEDQTTLYREAHYDKGLLHGVLRIWDSCEPQDKPDNKYAYNHNQLVDLDDAIRLQLPGHQANLDNNYRTLPIICSQIKKSDTS